MTEHQNRLREPSRQTARTWRFRRLILASPLAILFGFQLARLARDQGVLVALYAVLVAAVGACIIYAFVAYQQRQRERNAPPDALHVAFGRFRLDELIATRYLAGMSVKETRFRGAWRGRVEGTILITRSAIGFRPGRFATRSGVRPFDIPFADVRSIEIVPMSANLNIGLTVRLADGLQLNVEVRGKEKSRLALARSELGDPTPEGTMCP